MMRANNKQYSTLYLYLISHAVPWLWYCRSPIICGRYVTTTTIRTATGRRLAPLCFSDNFTYYFNFVVFVFSQIYVPYGILRWYMPDRRTVEQSNSRTGVVNVSGFVFLARKSLSILYRFNVNANKITCIFYSNHAISKSFFLRHQIFRRK